MPSPNEIANSIDYALRSLPVAQEPQLRTVGMATMTSPLSTSANGGGCDPEYLNLFTVVQNAQTNDGNKPDWVYYGFLPRCTPANHDNHGCTTGAVAVGLIGNTDDSTFVHEIGHIMGLPHAPCGRVGQANPAYPIYENYDQNNPQELTDGTTIWEDASIGEYGLDIDAAGGMTVLPPATTEDLMSYCGPRWISIYTHNCLLGRPELGAQNLCWTAGHLATRTGLITIIGFLADDDQAMVTGVSRTEGHIFFAAGEKSTLTAELLGEGDRVLTSVPLYLRWSDGTGFSDARTPGRVRPFRAVMRDVDIGSALRITDGTIELWRRDRPAEPPTADGAEVELTGDGTIRLRWNAGVDAESVPETWIRWSADDGQSWNGLAVGVDEDEFTISRSQIRADRVCFQVLVHDGFHTTSTRTDSIDLPPGGRAVAIFHPSDWEALPAGGALHLRGGVIEGDADEDELGRAVWTIDGEQAGLGIDLWSPMPEPGEHQLVLSLGDTEIATAIFVVE